ncbi:hypothetical protein H4R26_002426 [Coemansia thaxteri]|uniref:TATA element modulatory factor 1 TATA binding domain-containing protein n=1 Tax=Coemansia thaxteri TaxID=2663907 RepID=A0A9W8BK07_9FUNG|nr:hypothetical protein H4R26_002426 [Coemansia thaxteri]
MNPQGASSGGGGWSNMLKSALSQVETHLDRYLEVPADGAAAGAKGGARGTVANSRGGGARGVREAARPTAPAPAEASSVGGAGNSAAPTIPAEAKEEKQGSGAVAAPAGPLTSTNAVAAPPDDVDSDLADAFALDLSADQPKDDPYIQSELKKLRQAGAPAAPEAMRATIGEYARRIEALLLEGQQWSAKELRLSTSIKKLRADNRALERAAQKRLAEVEALKKLAETESAKRLAEGESLKRLAEGEYSRRLADADARRHALERELAAAADARDAAERQAAAQRVRVDELQQRVMAAEDEARDREAAALARVRALNAQARADAPAAVDVLHHTQPLLRQIEDLHARITHLRHAAARADADWAARLRDAARDADHLRARLADADAAAAAARADAELLRAAAEARAAEVLAAAKQNADLLLRLDALELQLEEACSVPDRPESRETAASAPPATSPELPDLASVPDRSPLPRDARLSPAPSPSPSPSPSPASQHPSTKILAAQITALKAQLQSALRQKNDYAASQVAMSLELDRLRAADHAAELLELRRRHETALEMLGEKTEQVLELRADIAEIKAAYRQQLQGLL